MRKIIFILISIICLSGVETFAQFMMYNQPQYWNVYYLTQVPVDLATPENIAKITFVDTYKNGKTHKYIREYDQLGRITNNYFPDKKGETTLKYKYVYSDTASNPTEITEYTPKEEFKQKISYLRTEDNRLYEYSKINSKQKIVEKSTWKYEGIKLLRSDKYKSGGEEIKQSWVYLYDDNFNGIKQNKTLLLNSKGETVYEWIYDCNEEGTKLDKQKDQTQICQYHKTEDNYLTWVYQTFDEKGKIAKYISKYTLADTLLVEVKTLDGNDQLQHKTTFDFDRTRPLSYEYYKKGVLQRKQVRTYKDNMLINIEKFSKKGYRGKEDFFYDNNKLLCGRKVFNSKNELVSDIEIEYVFY